MHNVEQIQRASHRMRRILAGVIIVMPLINAMVWLFINDLPVDIYREILPHFVTMPLPATTRLMGFLVTMVSASVVIVGALHLMRLFDLYGKGSIFRDANVQCYKHLSRILIWWFAARIVERTLLGIALTLHNPPGQRMLTLGVSSSDLGILLIGFILSIITWVMEEGQRLQEDQDYTV